MTSGSSASRTASSELLFVSVTAMGCSTFCRRRTAITKLIVAEPVEDVLATDGFSREGSFADRHLVRDDEVPLPGKVLTVARQLGSNLGEKAPFAHELPRRRQATVSCGTRAGCRGLLVVWSTRLFRKHSTNRSRRW